VAAKHRDSNQTEADSRDDSLENAILQLEALNS
jgi:hypothetical protein